MVFTQEQLLKEYKEQKYSLEGTPGNFTYDQQRKMSTLWTLLLDYFKPTNPSMVVKVNSELLVTPGHQDWSTLQNADEPSGENTLEITKRAWKAHKDAKGAGAMSLKRFGSWAKKPTKSDPQEDLMLDRYANETVQEYLTRTQGLQDLLPSAEYFPSFEHPQQDTRNQRDVFWQLVSAKQHPDLWVYRYLLGADWQVDRALADIKECIQWRAQQAIDQLIYEGEAGTGMDENRLNIIRVVGRDRLGFPVIHVRVQRIWPRGKDAVGFKRYLVCAFESIQGAIRYHSRVTMLYDFTGFCLDNTPLGLLQFMVALGCKQYAESSSALVFLVDSWLFTNLWSLVKPFLDPNVSARVVFAKTLEEARRFIDDGVLPEEVGGQNRFATKFVVPKAGENEKMFDLEGRKRAEEAWRQSIGEFEMATREWCKHIEDCEEKGSEYVSKRDERARQLEKAELELSQYTKARTMYHRLGMIDEQGCLANF